MKTAAIKAAGLNWALGSLGVIGSNLQEFQAASVDQKRPTAGPCAGISQGPGGQSGQIDLKRTRLGRAPSSPRRFFLSASYSW